MLLLVGAAEHARAETVTLAWDPNPASDNVAGYTVHVGVNPGSYGQTFTVHGGPTTFTFTQAQPGIRYYFAVSAYTEDLVSGPLSAEVSWKLNVGPTLSQPATQIGTVGVASWLQLSANDDGDPLTFSASGLPSGLWLNSSTGRISGTPTTVQSRNVTVTVSDGQLTATRTFTWTVTAPLRATGLSSNLAAPQPAGTFVTFTGNATGGVPPYQFKWWVYDGRNWTMAQNWGGSTFTWKPTVAGDTYRVGIWVRDATTSADTNAVNLSIPYPISASTPLPALAITGLTGDLPSPQPAGTSITFTAAATGGTGPYQFKWWVYDGTTWTMVQDWGEATFTWRPVSAGSDYRVGIWARDATTTADSNAVNLSIPYTISGSAPQPALTITGLTSSLPSPQLAATSIAFTAAATGGVAPYQFKWWVYDGTTWTMVQDWGGATYTWRPTSAGSGYRVGIWARDATTTADTNAVNLSIPYTISGSAPPVLTVTGLTSSLPSPQPAATSITFTAAATGGVAPYQFKWWVYDGTTWTMVQDWGGSTYVWTPLRAGTGWRVGIWVRDATTTADTNAVNFSTPFIVISGTP